MVVRTHIRQYPVIKKISPDGAVAACVCMAVGDEVVQVDDVDCANKSANVSLSNTRELARVH